MLLGGERLDDKDQTCHVYDGERLVVHAKQNLCKVYMQSAHTASIQSSAIPTSGSSYAMSATVSCSMAS